MLVKSSRQAAVGVTTRLLLVVISLIAASEYYLLTARTSTVAHAVTPTAQPISPDPKLGAVYVGTKHLCTGSVLDSPAGDLILTAGHCVGMGPNETFVAGLHGPPTAEEFWRIDTVYLDPRWLQHHDPLADFAIARVSRNAGEKVESQPGLGVMLGATPKPGTAVALDGYTKDTDLPVGCQFATATTENGYPEADCAQMLDGTSGSPWLEGSTVTGLIGGPYGGGCEGQVTNYSPLFDDAIKRLLARAETGDPGDIAPQVDGDAGCPGAGAVHTAGSPSTQRGGEVDFDALASEAQAGDAK
jgi:hypothetical protein